MKENYDETVKKYKCRPLTSEENKGLTKEVQKILKPIFADIDRTLMNNPCSNFRF